MFKKFFIFLFLLFFTSALQAEEIPLSKAAAIAADFMNHDADVKSAEDPLVLLWDGRDNETKSEGFQPAFYVFGRKYGNGFVVVAADDLLRPVLAWSDEDEFIVEDMPDNIRWWCEEVCSQLSLAQSNLLTPYSASSERGEEILKYKTASWNQGDPYNMYCPEQSSKRTVTGCVATAMAIKMHYHRWPDAGVGLIPEYETSSGLKVNERQLGQPYLWDNMPFTHVKSDKWTEEEMSEVAVLMADCGASVRANYRTTETSASEFMACNSMKEYFKYDASAYVIEKNWYSDQGWHDQLQEQLTENGPVYYTGDNENGGHAFIIDGYTSKNYYHVNWGWGGNDNGFFALTAMDPSSALPYNYEHNMIVDLKPDEGGESPEMILFYSTDIDGVPYHGISVLETDPSTGFPSLVNLGGFWNKGDEDYEGKFRFGIFDRDMNLVKELWKYETDYPLFPNSYLRFDNIRINISDVDFGYRLVAQFYNTHKGEWEMVRANRDYDGVDMIPLADEYSIEESTKFRYSVSDGLICLTVKDGVEVTCEGRSGAVAVESPETNEWHIDTMDLEAGTYTVTLTDENEKVKFDFIVGGDDNE